MGKSTLTSVSIIFSPITFGFGPAAIATAVARELRVRRPDITIIGAGDGIGLDFMRASQTFEALLECQPGVLPNSVNNDKRNIVVSFVDFERAGDAVSRGLRTIIVDPLYWMWDDDPIDPAAVDLYIAVAFPGVIERIEHQGPRVGKIRIVPPIIDLTLPVTMRKRTGTLVNLGGAVTPLGNNYAYLRALTEVIAETSDDSGELLVACSSVAAKMISRPAPIAGVTVEELPFDKMMSMLESCALLLTVPGQSIMWEALRMRIPTILLPGSNYSQHRQVLAFRRFVTNVAFITWDDLDGYHTLPSGMPENLAVASAVQQGNRMATDKVARRQLSRLLAVAKSGSFSPPSLQAGNPWSNFDGAARVVDEIIELLRKLNPKSCLSSAKIDRNGTPHETGQIGS